ncbi:MAG: OpgC domain-containing protein [Beijerinckiaceae bacterium]|nr:OpgC domain-containing protein [Beijerinckiaceae bacterium]
MDELAKRRTAPTPSVPPKVRGTRPPNEIDFWRGFALIAIFINHVPGIFFERFTHRNFGFSDSAELFVLLAGWSLRAMVDRAPDLQPFRLVLRIGGRALVLYIAQQVITVMAVAMIAATALITDTPLVLQWNNAAAMFEEPVTANIGVVILTHHLGYFDILPLYIILMSMAPVMAIVYRASPTLLLLVSGGAYAATLYTGFNLPTWPVEGRWFFNPFAWQFIFAIGYMLGGEGPSQRLIRKYRLPLRLLGGLFVLYGVFAALYGWYPDWLSAPEPAAFFVVDKTFQTPLRLLHVLALAALIGGSFIYLMRYIRPIVRFFSMLGRNSLNVFCVGSLLSLAGQIVRFAYAESLWVDTAVLIVGLIALSITAWVSEWRLRLRG